MRKWGIPSIVAGTVFAFVCSFALAEQPSVTRTFGEFVPRRVPETHPPVSFRLTPTEPTFAHKFSLSKPGPGMVVIQWFPQTVKLQMTLQPPAQIGAPVVAPIIGKETEPGTLVIPFEAQQGSLQNWVVKVQSVSGLETSVTGNIVVIEGSQPGRKRPYTSTERLTRAMQNMDGENPILPILVHAIERHLQGVQDKSDMDLALERALRSHPQVTRKMLEQFVNDYKSVPQALRMKVTPRALQNLTPQTKLEMKTLAPVMREIRIAPRRPIGFVTASSVLTRLESLQVLKPEEFAPVNPHIDRLNPDSQRSYDAGQTVDILGSRFSPEREKNKVHILVDFYGDKAVLQTLTPTLATPNALRVTFPQNLEPGLYYIQIETKTMLSSSREEQWMKSNTVDFRIKVPPPPPPVINQISPPQQYPGRGIIVSGKNFVPGRETHFVWEPLDFDIPEGMATSVRADVRSPTELRVDFPLNLLPGRYAMRVHIRDVGHSDPYTYTVKTPRFRVIFTKFRCIDETNPERPWFSDEIVTMWAVVADANLWTKQTGEYRDVDEGEERNYSPGDRVVFRPDGQAGEVRAVLAIATTLYEWDEGDVRAAQQFIGVVGEIANAIASALGHEWLGKILGWVFEGIGVLVSWFGGDPDGLGRQELGWTFLELMQRTGKSGRFDGTLEFPGGDYRYRVWYEVYRVED